MTGTAFVLDLTVVTCLLLLARQALFRPALFAVVVYFIAFSLLLALAWARLQAPDVALAEAAIGAGLTGALLLAAVRRMQSANGKRAEEGPGHGDG
jgi:uncharacterized MnhB-related membrane protein